MNENAHDRIGKRVKAKKAFLTHAGVYVAVALFFLVMNIATFDESGEWWFFFPMLPWGVGLLIHYFSVFGFPGTQNLVEKWEIEETAREMRQMHEDEEELNRTLPSGQQPEDKLDLPELKKRKDSLYNDDEFV